MSDVKWIKIVVDIFDDEKIKLLEAMPDGDAIVNIWVKLLCLAGKQNCNGFLMISERVAYTDEMLSIIFRKPVNTVRLALDAFEGFGMIQRSDIGAVSITNWEKYQNFDALERMKESNKNRQAAYRQRKALKATQSYKELNEGSNVTSNVTDNVTKTDVSRDCSVTVTPLDIDIDKEIDINISCPISEKSNDKNTVQKKTRSKSTQKNTPTKEQEILFAEAYEAYPRHENKKAAWDAWMKITPVPDKVLVERIIAVIQNKLSTGMWEIERTKYIPLFSTFLNGRKWEDEITLPFTEAKPRKTDEEIAAERAAYQREIELSERNAPRFI